METLNHSEAEVVDLIYRIARRLAPRYRFAYHEVDDLVQEMILAILEHKLLERYDPSRPLENFLCVIINNRLKNFKRDNYERPGITDSVKINVIMPISLDNVKDEHEKNMWTKLDFASDMEIKEIFNIIDLNLPVHLRGDYLRMKQGVLIPKPRREKVETAIIDILQEYGYAEDT